MNPRNLLAGVALAALAVGTAAVIETRGDEKPIDGARETQLEPSKLALARDGGKTYIAPVRLADGGVESRIVSAGCLRRPRGDRSCVRLDGGDPGELNRYPAAQLTGSGCESVACSVYLGDDADESEDVRVARARDGGERPSNEVPREDTKGGSR